MSRVRATVVWCVSQLLGSSLEGGGEETGRDRKRERERVHVHTQGKR